MRAVVVMFDSLNRRMLPPYGAQDVHAPNFERLAKNSVAFENCYAGSMPCMPARREMHTGRYNFLHRSWGPLEPFDDSMPEIMKSSGIYTHLVTDHQHYWEDGGATYHTRYNTHEFFRGQEGDPWKGHVKDVQSPESLNGNNPLVRQDWINRQYLQNEADHPQTRTFDAGLEFIETNREADNWFLQIECFDPHEPFFSYDDHRAHYDDNYDGVHFDWPSYRRVTESQSEVDHAKNEYLALLSMCDASLGRVLDAFDQQNLWDDTMLIVCTDHGFLLGEQGWWGKSVQPWFDQNIHTPLFIWDPRSRQADTRRDALVQTIDFAPTLLDFFGLTPTPDMQGQALARTIIDDTAVREGALFGVFGAHVNVTDGRYVYMRSCATAENAPLFDYTLMPTHMRSRFNPQELQNITLAQPFTFTKGVSPLKVPGWVMGNPHTFGTLLFDLHTDPDQLDPLRDDEIELRMANLMLDLMRANNAPIEQYDRLGLPQSGRAVTEHLLVGKQWAQMQSARVSAVRVHEMPEGAVVVTVPLNQLLDDSRTAPILLQHFPGLGHPGLRAMLGRGTVLEAAAMGAGIGADRVHALEAVLSKAFSESGVN